MKEMNDHHTEARAMIIWGKPQDEVESYLRDSGIDEKRIKEWISVFISERNNEVRSKGKKNTLIGFGIIGVMGALIYFAIPDRIPGQVGIGSEKYIPILAVVLLWGLWKCMSGIFDIVAPEKRRGSISVKNGLS
jgi:hypothetical protein